MRIKELIKQKGFTQKEFANRLGISTNALYQIITGNPSRSKMQEIADALGVEIWELFVSREKIMEDHPKMVDDPNVIMCPVCRSRFKLDKI